MKTPQLLLVDDDPGMIQVMAKALHGMGRLRFATSGVQALAQMADDAPDVVLLDADMPGLKGFDVCARMRDDARLSEVPVIFVTGHTSPEDELRGLEAGAADFIAKPIREALLVARVRTQLRMKALTDQLRAVACTDALTGAANRRSFDEALDREWRSALRQRQPLSLLMVDVDHFKAYNDLYGHQDGDGCLRQVAQALEAAVKRPADVVARYGGEEFAVLLPGADRRGAEEVARRLAEELRHRALPHAGSKTAAHITASVGISTFEDGELTRSGEPLQAQRTGAQAAHPDDLVRAADVALYAAKKAGRACAWRIDMRDAAHPERALPIGTACEAAETPDGSRP
jgi:diguanylate cyclase (GGDEF)-like protein